MSNDVFLDMLRQFAGPGVGVHEGRIWTTRGCSSYFYIKLSEQNVLSIYSHNKTVEIGKNLILSEYKKLHAADCLLNIFSELCHLES